MKEVERLLRRSVEGRKIGRLKSSLSEWRGGGEAMPLSTERKAETLFNRLEQSRFASLVAGPAPPDAEPLIAHAAWLNDLEALEATRRRLGAEMRGYWDAQVFPKSERVEAE